MGLNKAAEMSERSYLASDSDTTDIDVDLFSDSDDESIESPSPICEQISNENENGNNEEDEVIKAIIKENQKPRDKPPSIQVEDFVADICFHPKEDILAIANIVGDVVLYRYSNDENTLLDTVELHTKACRDVEFSADGKTMYTVSKDMSVMLTDVETRKLTTFFEKAHENPIYCLSIISPNTFATGDDNGIINIWDSRQRTALLSVTKNEDYISDIIPVNHDKYLCCSSGDGSLTTIDLCNNKFLMQSVEYEEELTCLGTVRHETKLVSCSNKGKLFIFNMREFGMHSDEFPATKSSISSFVPITENLIVTACEDGNLRAVHLFPHRHIGIVGQHEMSIEHIDICNDGRFLASCSADNDIKFWNIKFFEEFEKLSHKHNRHQTKKEMQHNLPSSSRTNIDEFFSDLA